MIVAFLLSPLLNRFVCSHVSNALQMRAQCVVVIALPVGPSFVINLPRRIISPNQLKTWEVTHTGSTGPLVGPYPLLASSS